MKTVIIFHSVCGNDYLLAMKFKQALKDKGHALDVYRVADEDWKEQTDWPETTKKLMQDMIKVPVASPQVLLDADLIVMGCPTYFGNVSAEMKLFMDQTACYWFDAQLAGKKFIAFTSTGNPEGGGDLCLQALHIYAKYMSLLSLAIPPNILSGVNCHSFGIIHYSYAKYAEALDEKTAQLIDKFVERVT